jgi:hypothetical protein
MRADEPTAGKFWAVAKVAGATPQVAIKFNHLPPVLMSAEGAREFAAAINAEFGKSNTRQLCSSRLA